MPNQYDGRLRMFLTFVTTRIELMAFNQAHPPETLIRPLIEHPHGLYWRHNSPKQVEALARHYDPNVYFLE
jgi:hypothetical protein